MFSLLLVIVVIALFVYQNNRISALERLIKGKSIQPAQQNPAQSNTVVTADASAPVTASPTQQAPVAEKKADDASSGRLLGRLGIGAVLIGVAFFLKYAFENNWIGPAGRVMIGVLFGLGFLAVGQYLRKKYLSYSDLVMGGGAAILYLSVFSAHSFYNLIDSGTTGILMFVVTALVFAISIVNATMTLSVVGVIGAFATPFLVGSHENAMFTLFSYITLINVGVLGISFFKKWPKLNVISYIGGLINFLAWYGMYYKADVLAPTLLFVFVTFIIFIAASVARGVTAGVKTDPADFLLLGGNALVFAFTAYTILNPEFHSILGFGAAFIAVIYIVVAYLVNKMNPTDLALNIFLPGLAVAFLSVAVPLQFSGAWIAVVWFVEACVLYGIASIINNRGFQVMGVVVYVLGLLDFITWTSSQSLDQTYIPIFNAAFGVMLLAIVAAYGIAEVYRRYGSITVEIQKRGIIVFVIIANVLTLYTLTTQITDYHAVKIMALQEQYQASTNKNNLFTTGYDTSANNNDLSSAYYDTVSSTRNQSNTLVSILWTLYAALLTALGFARRIISLRRMGLALFIITAVKVVIDVWSLGQLYRIISFIAFGIIALVASFGYAKYKDRLKDIV